MSNLIQRMKAILEARASDNPFGPDTRYDDDDPDHGYPDDDTDDDTDERSPQQQWFDARAREGKAPIITVMVADRKPAKFQIQSDRSAKAILAWLKKQPKVTDVTLKPGPAFGGVIWVSLRAFQEGADWDGSRFGRKS